MRRDDNRFAVSFDKNPAVDMANPTFVTASLSQICQQELRGGCAAVQMSCGDETTICSAAQVAGARDCPIALDLLAVLIRET